MTCIVHPTQRDLKARIALLEAALRDIGNAAAEQRLRSHEVLEIVRALLQEQEK
jgi:hypothetical protein